MAAILTAGPNQNGVRSRRASIRIDMTPMVDLGFLLITFFMLATTLDKPHVIQLNIPQHPPKTDYAPVKASHTLTVFLEKDGQVRYIIRQAASQRPEVKTVPMGPAFRRLLLEANRNVPGKQLLVLIKPTRESTYKQLVDVLDELAITRIKRYALDMALTPDDQALLAQRQFVL